MTSLLRQIVAGPRAKHAETGLDLCYVTSNIIATSGPSQTYPQRAYRNPLDQLVAFLDAKHGDGWAIWEFRAEGTGYPDEAVYGRIRHYPWPDHHPPPFRLVPMIMASMRQWLSGGQIQDNASAEDVVLSEKKSKEEHAKKSDRVVVVHCKAGKGRSGTMACSYLISECGWTPEDALARFTNRRMRPNFGAGVSIPSQLRCISYVDRWTKGGKKYLDREIKILEVHIWGLRQGVKISIEGYVDEGKKIKNFHTFTKDERIVVEGDAPGSDGVTGLVSDMAGYGTGFAFARAHVDSPSYDEVVDGSEPGTNNKPASPASNSPSPSPSRSASKKLKNSITKKLSTRVGSPSSQSFSKLGAKDKSKTIAMPATSVDQSTASLPVDGAANSLSQSQTSLKPANTANSSEPGGQAVILKPSQPIRIPNSDVNISVERRNRASASMGLTMVTSVAHVWFNTFFEGNGPEQDGKPDDSGVFEIEWDKMDGIKGSSQKGTRACDRLSVVWRAVGADSSSEDLQTAASTTGHPVPEIIREPGMDSPVPDVRPADWKGGNKEDPSGTKQLGLRAEDPESAGVSKASSIKSEVLGNDSTGESKPTENDEDLEGVKTSGPSGKEIGDGTTAEDTTT